MDVEFLPGNRLRLLNSGAEYFPALLAALDAARGEIFLESYIFADDNIGHAVADALCRAAARGVQVNVTVDGFGGRNFSADFLPRLSAAGVRAMLYRPEIGRFHMRRHRLRRLHRKLVVVDSCVAFIGGINIIDDNNTPQEMRPRYDYAVRIEGPILAQIQPAVRHMWEIVTWVNFKRRLRSTASPTMAIPAIGTQSAAFLIRDNIRHRNDILNAYIAAIGEAKREILIANAYFLPGVRFVRALLMAAKRGVQITVMLQGKTDHPLLRFAAQALYVAVLKNNIRIFEYEKSFMHAKVAVIDGEWATVGSSNIDPFSLLLAKEANLVVRDAGFAGQLRQSLQAAMNSGAQEVISENFARQHFHSRLLQCLSYGVVRLLLGLTGYGSKHGQADDEMPIIPPKLPDE